jgi:predicted small metal-binding protein
MDRNNISYKYRDPCIFLQNMKTLTCRDAGFDCGAVIKGETEDEIMQKAGDHAKTVHNMKPEDMTPEFQQKIKGLIRNS